MDKILPEYDIVIVGAGPAGCITAYFLSQNYNVLLLDWSRFPRDKPCGGILVEESKQFVENLKMPASIFSYPKAFDIKYADFDNDFEIVHKRGFYNITRRSFDYWLLKLSEKKIQFLPETKFLNFKQTKNGVDVLIERHNKKHVIKSKYIIGADGALSRVRAQISSKSIRQYFAIQEWMKSYFDTKELIFIYDSSINDYYSWIIPKGNYLIVGLAVKPGDNAENKLALFKSKLSKKYGIYGKVFKKEGALSLRPKSMSDCILGKGNIMLVGEAAGLVSPSTGEGISFALRSGYNCAKALNENFKNGFEIYRKLCQPLVKEIENKAKKAEILSNPIKRLGMLKSINK